MPDPLPAYRAKGQACRTNDGLISYGYHPPWNIVSSAAALGWGRLTGKIRRGQPAAEGSRMATKAGDAAPSIPQDDLYDVIDVLDEVAKENGKTIPQIALNWLLGRPTVSTLITGARNEDQLRANLAAVGWTLSPEHVARLDKVSERQLPYPYCHQQMNFKDRNPLAA